MSGGSYNDTLYLTPHTSHLTPDLLTCGEQTVEAGPEDPEKDGAQEREEITGVSETSVLQY